ncbi:hypothetical protein [Gemmata sp.]
MTDAGLKELAAVKSLAQVSLKETAVTDAGVKKLGEALPKCKVER